MKNPPSLPQYHLESKTETALVWTGSCILMAIEIADVDEDHTSVLNDSVAGDGTDILKVTSAAEKGGVLMDFSKLGGIRFANGIYATITGTGQEFYWIA